ncbi:hypothetical protein NLO413_0734 [Candidatus Neoehrlichia lotoris str. RAC413]|uniref:Uncharacterized protein n=1 Tax=Candidatus Neoehrlichia procyonis str. RAC413 TaxID=1359163 RepID=A0A0F3NMR3_9RICK|nr:hypothetical protein NLO413_0734 [Candidatus Neoehrlichia lotoris str. RAC413]
MFVFFLLKSINNVKYVLCIFFMNVKYKNVFEYGYYCMMFV